jgi:hypothetical protein
MYGLLILPVISLMRKSDDVDDSRIFLSALILYAQGV